MTTGGPPPRVAAAAPLMAAERPPGACAACQGAHRAHTCGKQPTKRRKVAPPPLEPPRVVVVGAGIAGIGCARALEQLGAVVTVVEAKPRVGGRCASTKINEAGAAVDLGASWIHGIRKNPLYAAACQLGLHCVDTGDDVALRDGVSGAIIQKDGSVDARAFDAFNAALAAARKQGEANATEEAKREGHAQPRAMPRHGVQQALGPAVAAELRATLKDDPAALKLVQWHRANMEYANACPMDALSLRFWDQDDEHAYEGSHCAVREGLGALCAGLARPLREVRLQWPVARIEKRNDMCIVTSEAGETLVAEVVVVTVPLGVLKHDACSFVPPLPAWKARAISRLGFGILDKVALKFDRPFWRDAKFWGGVPKRPGNLGRVLDVSESGGEFFLWVDLEGVTNEAVLVALCPAANAERFEVEAGFTGGSEAVRKAPEKVVNKCLEALRKMLNASMEDKASWCVKGATATAWRDDKRSLGSYSFLAPGCVPDDVDALAAPCWDGALRWAGEHTSREHLATAAGALESGRAEARRIARETGLLSLSDEEEEEAFPHVAKPKRPSRDAARTVKTALSVRSFARRDTPEDACALCGLKSGADADCEGFMAGPLLAFRQGSGGRVLWCHDGCAAASSEVRVLDDAWFHVHAAVSRGRRINCASCGQKGATLGCIDGNCPHSYHGRCAALHQKWDLRQHRPLNYPTRSAHAVFQSDSSDDEGDPLYPAFSCLQCRPKMPPQKAYALHCTAPSRDGRPAAKRKVSAKLMQRPVGAPRRAPPFVRPPTPTGEAPAPVLFGAPRHALLLPRRVVAAPAPAAPWVCEPAPPPVPDWARGY